MKDLEAAITAAQQRAQVLTSVEAELGATPPRWIFEAPTFAAGEKSPKEYIGWNNDPENPEFLRRRATAKRLMQSISAAASKSGEAAK